MTYKLPHDVTSPKREMTLDRVLIAGPGERETSYALQLWHRDGEDREYGVGVRWNGDDEKKNGTPNISGHACWFVLDRALWPAVLAMVPCPSLRDYAAEKLYRNGGKADLGRAALDQEDGRQDPG